MQRRAFLGTVAAGALVGAGSPLRLGMVGLVHGHAAGFLSRYRTRTDVALVAIAEADRDVASRYIKQFSLDPTIVHTTADELLDKARPEGVVVFTSTSDHLKVVDACVRRRVPVMMEKPLATTMDQARAIERMASAAGVPVLVNYETTWYPSNRAAWSVAKDQQAIGAIRKVVVHAGHRGPKELGVQREFLAWLTDPVQNGGGALFDFGCYGANLTTWLMDNARPTAVTAVTQQIKPDVYPKVDDEATIILEYPGAQAIVQASWNWPFNRKDVEVYGRTGSVQTIGADALAVHVEGRDEERRKAPAIAAPEDDFLRYFSAVIRGETQPSGLSSLANNVIVTEILDAARRSAAAGKRVVLA